MSPSPIAAAARYIHAEVARVYWVVTIADTDAPTRVELDAGTDLTAEIAAVVGWHVRARTFDAQTFGQDFAVFLDGALEVDDSRLIFYADPAGDDIRTLLSRGTDGHVVMLPGGDVTGRPMDVWPVRVAALGRPIQVGSEAARVDVQFVVRADPVLDLLAPAP